MEKITILLILSLLILASEAFSQTSAIPLTAEQITLSAVCYLTETYLGAGHDLMVSEMKYLKKRYGKKFVFSAIQIEGKTSGKVLYHPTPFVTGQNVTTASDADGRSPGKDAMLKARKLQNRQGLWTEYAVKNPVSGERETRYMFCERWDERMICGSLPGKGKMPTQTVFNASGTCF